MFLLFFFGFVRVLLFLFVNLRIRDFFFLFGSVNGMVRDEKIEVGKEEGIRKRYLLLVLLDLKLGFLFFNF